MSVQFLAAPPACRCTHAYRACAHAPARADACTHTVQLNVSAQITCAHARVRVDACTHTVRSHTRECVHVHARLPCTCTRACAQRTQVVALSLLAALLITRPYLLAMSLGLLEWSLEGRFTPQLKQGMVGAWDGQGSVRLQAHSGTPQTRARDTANARKAC